jgi:hypothetical protein
MSEQFKQIKEYPEYVINDKGIIKRNGKVRKPTITPKGYLRIRLSNNNVVKNFFVHRLVYETFIGDIPNGYYVNHIDENKQNNSIDNLNLMTNKENDNWGTRNSKIGRTSKQYILQKTLDGTIINRYNSSRVIFKTTDYDYINVLRCCKGQRKTHKGYLWEFDNK